jgi:hypothetical protein
MENERIFNILIYFVNGVAYEYGLRLHQSSDHEAKKLELLKASVDADLLIAKRFSLSRDFTINEWRASQRIGIDLSLFEEGFRHYRAPHEPLIGIKMICDGVTMVDLTTNLEPFEGHVINQGQAGLMQDWLVKYTEGEHIRIDKLIDDDYYDAIKILFNSRHLVSAAKLLMSCIDTLAFVEFGDERGNFTRWMDAFVQLDNVGITSAELWEFCNSIIHMTNLKSRAVLSGKVSPIMPYIGCDQLGAAVSNMNPRPFNLHSLLIAVASGIAAWSETFNVDREKFSKFVERYDSIISDSRMAMISGSDFAFSD